MTTQLTRRQRYEQRTKRRSFAIAAASTAIVLTAVAVLLPMTSGWQKVRHSFFDGSILRFSLGHMLGPFWYDVQIFLWCAPCILLGGLALAFARNVRSPALFPLKLFSTVYTDVFRGVPMVLWITLIGFGVPGLLQSRNLGRAVIWGSVALIAAYSAYVGEVFRAGIESIHESQRAAARSLGMTSTQTMRHVILPQAIRRVVPPLMNDLVSLQKDVALISILGPVEVLRQAGIDKAKFFNFTPYVAAAVLFLCVSVPLTRTTDHLLQRERRRTGATAVR